MDDWELLERYRDERSQPAFAELVARHAGLVYGVCRRRVRDAHLAEDMAQAVFLLLARRPPTRRGKAALAGWLYQTAVYACMNATRAQRIRDRHEQQAVQERAGAGAGGAGGAAALTAVAVYDSAPVELELAEEMDRALAKLSASDRDALLLRYYQGLTVGDVGRALGVTEDTAAKRLSRAIERLRCALTSRGEAVTNGGAVAVAAPLSAASLGTMLTSVTQAPAPPALAAKLVAVASAGAEAGAVSAVVEHVVSGITLLMKQAQIKLLAVLGAIAMVTGGAIVTTVVLVNAHAPDRAAAAATANVAPQQRADALVAEGWALWQRQKYAAAETKFQQAVDLVPTYANAWNGLGWSQFHTPDHDAARASFLRCVELFPGHGAAINGLGQLALGAGDDAEAERWFLRGADTAPAAAHGLARLYVAQARWDEARAALAKLRQSGDYGDHATFRRMLAAVEARHVDDDLRAALLPRPLSPVARQIQRAWALAREGKLDEAEAQFEDAFAQAPDDPDVLSGFGWFRFNTGDGGQARELFERALQVDADHLASTNGLAQTYLASSEFDRALPLFEQLASRMPGNEAVQYGLERAREGAKR